METDLRHAQRVLVSLGKIDPYAKELVVKGFLTCAPEREKIIYRFISNHLVFAAERSGALVLNSANILIPNVPELSFEALLALLNSKVYSFVYQVLFGQIKVLRSNLLQLKFPRISSEQDDELKALVYAAEAKLTDDIEEEINRAVFNIYGLDDDEISVIRKRLEA